MIYKTTLWLFILSILTARGLLAQQVKVIDKTTLQPIEEVYIYNNSRNKVVSTNFEGRANLQKFSLGDTLTFQHPAFQRLSITLRKIIQNNYLVKLAERSVVMDEIFVSASKRAQEITDIPQKIERIDQEQILFNNPQTAADLLQNSSKVFVQKSQLGGGSPMIRGFAANSVLIAVDGIRINNAIFRGGNLQNVISIDPYALESTEVLFGPGSIIYGSDALGGVMNFRTKSPELSFAEGKTISHLNTMANFSSANNGLTFHVDAGMGFEKWGVLTSITYSKFGDLRSGGNFYDDFPDFGKREEYVIRRNATDVVVENDDVTLQRFSGYKQLNLMQKFRYKISNKWKATYGFHYATTGDIPRYDRLIERENGDTGQFVSAEWYYGPQIWMMNSLNVEHFAQSTLFDKVSGTFTQQWFQESRNDRDFRSTQLRNREENVHVYITSLDFDKYFNENKELFYGLEGIYNYVASEATETNINTGTKTATATRYPDGGSDYTQLAAYAKYKQDLAANLTIIAGSRYSHILLNADFGEGTFYDFPFENIELNTGALSGSLGLTYRPWNNLQFNLKAATGFRAPNVDDVAKVFDSEPGTVIVPNPNLKPEHSYNLDFSIIKDFNESARLEINTYYTWLKNAMVRGDFQFAGQDSIIYDGVLSKVEAMVNSGQAYIYGASIGFSAELNPNFGLNSVLTYTNGRDISNNEPLRHVAPIFGMAGITYKAEKIRIKAYTEFNGKKDISDFSPSERSKTHLYTPEGTPAWATFNMRASWQINPEIQINAGVENIFDQHYRPYSSGISAPGINFTLTLRARL